MNFSLLLEDEPPYNSTFAKVLWSLLDIDAVGCSSFTCIHTYPSHIPLTYHPSPIPISPSIAVLFSKANASSNCWNRFSQNLTPSKH
jgi:hypothetical protein